MKSLKIAYELLAGATRATPPELRYGFARTAGSAWYFASPQQRRNAHSNYAAALRLPPRNREVRRVARRAFQNYGCMLADFALIASLTPEELQSHISVHGLQHLDALRTVDLGGILAVPHMASWDMGASVAGVLGYNLAAVVDRFPGSLNEAVIEKRQGFGLTVIPLGAMAARQIAAVLRGGGLVALACDLPQGPGVEVNFFGRRATVPTGPASLALRTGAALLTAYTRWNSPGHYHVHVDPPISLPLTGDRRRDIAALMQAVVDRFELYITARPSEWFAFRPLFR